MTLDSYNQGRCYKTPTIINYYYKGDIMNAFLTLNPHIINLSKETLRDDFNFYLKTFYGKELGPRYYKHKDKQYPMGFTIETGKKFITQIGENHITNYIPISDIDNKEPHLHIIMDIPFNKAKNFVRHVSSKMRKKYPSLTTCFKFIKTKQDESNIYNYCLKEGDKFYTNKDLY